MTRFLPVLLLVTACAADPMPIEPNPTEVTRVRTVKEPVARPEFTGVVTSRKSSVISAQVQARIEKFGITSGQVIKAGELVAKLDDTELANRVTQARANEKAALLEAGSFGAQAGALRQSLVAETRLNKRGVSSSFAVTKARAELSQVGSQAAAAMAKAMTARAAREQAEKDLTRVSIFAPLGGIVTNIKAHEGEIAQIGTPLARVFDPSDLIIRFAVPREQRSAIQLGQRVELAVDDAKRLVWATVTNISGAQEPPINFTVVEADIDDSKLAPGELTVASVGRVRIADARGAKQ
jgi:multidrug resistance efflux pump